MKPARTTLLTISLLLAASTLCLGLRWQADARQRTAARAKEATAHPTAKPAPSAASPTPVPRAPAPLPPPLDRESLLRQLRPLLASGSEFDRTREVLRLTSRFTPADWPLAMEALAALDVMPDGPLEYLFLSAWVESSPEAAMAWASARPDGAGESLVIQLWTGKDSAEALAYLKSAAARLGKRAPQLVARAMQALPANDLSRIGEVLMSMPEDQLDRVSRLDLKDISSTQAKDWLESLEPSLQPRAFRLLIGSLPKAVDKLALAEQFPGMINTYLYYVLYQDWMKEDETAALAHYETLEPGPARQYALGGIARSLAPKGEIDLALSLIRGGPDDLSRSLFEDVIIAAYPTQPVKVLAVIPELENNDARVGYYRMVLSNWMKQDPQKARQWMEENELPELVRRELEGK